MSTIGDRIKNKRKELGLTQAELGAKINVTDRAVSKWEQNEGNPDMSIIASLANVLGVSLDYLIIGKEDNTITLDDMDADKRLSLLIKKDDVENFVKYSYHTSPYLFGREQDMSRCFYHGTSKRVVVTSLNIQTWKDIISNKATKILNVCLDEFLKRNNSDGFWITYAVANILDEFVIAIVDLDRDDVLKAIGGNYFAIAGSGNYYNVHNSSNNEQPILVGPSNNLNDKQAYLIKETTLRYVFEKADSSPNCFKYMTLLPFKGVTADTLQTNIRREEYLVTFMDRIIVDLAVEFKKYDVVKKFLSQCYDAVSSIEQSQYEFYTIKDTYYFRQTYQLVEGRVFLFGNSLIEKLLINNQVDLAKEINKYNASVIAKFKNFSRLNNKPGENFTIMSDLDMDRFIKLNSDLPEDEMIRLKSVKNGIIVKGFVASLKDLKLVRELLDNNYYHYYELVYDKIKKGQTKELFEFFIDNQLDFLAKLLITDPGNYTKLLAQSFDVFTATKGKAYYAEYKSLISNQNPIGFEDEKANESMNRILGVMSFKEQFTKQYGAPQKYASTLEDNLIIDHIKELKEEIYNSIVNRLEAEKQAKKEAAEREKIAKGLTKDYFDNLLTSKKAESFKLFKLELCSLLDAIFLYDYHYAGEDFSERMNEHFKSLESTVPQERTMDDGWGYQVPDTKFTEDVVTPARNRVAHLRDLFYRLRVIRNNILHPEKIKVEELTEDEMRECLEYVFSINEKVEE